MPFIVVNSLSKAFQTQNAKGFIRAVKSAFTRDRTLVDALQEVSFSAEHSEMLGIIGPSGSGKTVLLKILSGILAPSAGSVWVDGMAPSENRKQNALRIGAVFGEKTHLHWNEPIDDIFALHQTIYQIPSYDFLKNRSRLIDLFDLGLVMKRTPAHLSDSEKTRANIALAMLHSPAALYLDVPMGNNPYTKRLLLEGLRAINKEWSTAVLFSTRALGDIASVCGRMLLLDQGAILYDGSYERFAMQHQTDFLIALEFDAAPQWRENPRFFLVHVSEGKWIVRVSPDLQRKDAFIALSHLYNPHAISECEQSIDDIVPKIKKGLKLAQSI